MSAHHARSLVWLGILSVWHLMYSCLQDTPTFKSTVYRMSQSIVVIFSLCICLRHLNLPSTNFVTILANVLNKSKLYKICICFSPIFYPLTPSHNLSHSSIVSLPCWSFIAWPLVHVKAPRTPTCWSTLVSSSNIWHRSTWISNCITSRPLNAWIPCWSLNK